MIPGPSALVFPMLPRLSRVAAIDDGNAPLFEPVKAIRFERRGIMPEMLIEAENAIYRDLGCAPTHFLLGGHTWLELEWTCSQKVNSYVPCADMLVRGNPFPTFRGIPIVLDPTRPDLLIAVPPIDRSMGRPWPRKACWPGEVNAPEIFCSEAGR